MRKKIVLALSIFSMMLFSASGKGAVAAEMASTSDVSHPEIHQSKRLGNSVQSKSNTKISGFVDSSFVADKNANTETFSFDQIELDIEGSTPDGKAMFHIDLNWFNRADDPATATNESNLNFDDVVEQGYIEVPFGGGDYTFIFGKFNAPIGWELLDAPDMFQFSHALVFDNGLPTNLTGAMITASVGIVDLSLYYVNGWDLITDDNTEKTIGGRLGISPNDTINIGFSHITGKEGAAAATPETLAVTDIDFTFTGVANLTIGAEYNQGKFTNKSAVVAGTDANWSGYMVMGHYDINDWFGITVRYDEFKDEDGQRLGNSINEKQKAYTIAPTFTIADGLGALLEFRSLTSSAQVFTDRDGNLTDKSESIAFEMTYSF